MITLDLATWAFLGGTIVPILVGILTKIDAHPGLKGGINVLLSAVAGLIATAITQDGVLTQEAIVAGFMAFVASIATYYGFLKPSGVSGSVQSSTAKVGVG